MPRIENSLQWRKAEILTDNIPLNRKDVENGFPFEPLLAMYMMPSFILNWLIVMYSTWERYISGHGGSVEGGRLMMVHFSITRQMTFLSKVQ